MMRPSDGRLLEARLDDLFRRLRELEERFGDKDKHEAEAPTTERRQAKPYMTAREAAEYLSVSRSLMSRWRCDLPGGPPFRKIGRRVVYATADLEKFLEERHSRTPLRR